MKRLADSLREKKGVPWAEAKLEQEDGEGTHVEFFRGKDFARHFRANPGQLEAALTNQKPGVCGLQQCVLVGHSHRPGVSHQQCVCGPQLVSIGVGCNQLLG